MRSDSSDRRRTRLPLATGFALALGPALGGASPVEAQQAPPVTAGAETITGATITEHLEFLASDALRGRNTPSPGLWTAADYLESHHRLYGLEPAGEADTYIQRYPYRLMAADPETARAAVVTPSERAGIDFGVDAFLDGASDVPVDAPLVVVSGPNGAPRDTDDLSGAVAVFALPGDWSQGLWQRALEQAAAAREEGAVAVLHVLDDTFPSDLTTQLTEALAEPAWRLGGDAYLPRIFVHRAVLDEVLEDGDSSWLSGSSPGGLRGVRLEAALPPRVLQEGEPPNVLARIPGSDPELRDEYVVLSAHFDHIGVGAPVDGDSINNGADDNGSGTSALLEIARVLAALPDGVGPRRTIVFAHVSGEEKGLLGSQWWVEHPTVPLDRVVANINVDMIGGRTHPDTVAALGREYSSLGPMIERVAAAHPELAITPVGDIWPGERLFFRSDQFNFMREGIPALFFFGGFHDCYHRPCDEVGFPDPDKIARVARLLSHAVLEVANSDEPPTWNPGAREEVQEIISGG